MTPFDFLRVYRSDRRVLRGDYYSSAPLSIEEGDRVGVVLFNLGGPESLDDVEPFLYNLLMDPAFLDLPVGGRARHWFAKSIAYFRAGALRDQYEVIGGGSPLTRLATEQASCLQSHLQRHYGVPAGVEFGTYPAMRYWTPSSEEAARQMKADGVDKVVLLPLYPQYSKATTGSALAYWNALDEAGEFPAWPTTTISEYAANPKYVQAVSERIDEALQRFPKEAREEVVLVFSAPGTPFQEMRKRADRYCCEVHSTVQQVMTLRNQDRPFHTAYQSMIGPNHWLQPSTLETIEDLADRGYRSVLVVPLTFVTDHVNISYELDIEIREEVEAYGVDHYEVTAGLNTHELFVEALAEATIAQLDLPVDGTKLRIGGDGVAGTYPLRPLEELPRHTLGDGSSRCPTCEGTMGARDWEAPFEGAEPGMSSGRPSMRRDERSEQSPESKSPSTS